MNEAIPLLPPDPDVEIIADAIAHQIAFIGGVYARGSGIRYLDSDPTFKRLKAAEEALLRLAARLPRKEDK